MPDNPGINQRALLELFNIIKQRQLDWDFTVIVSVLEVYNESIRDLLAVNHTEKMDVKQGPDGVYVPGLTQVSVTCLEEVNEVHVCKSLYQNSTCTGSKLLFGPATLGKLVHVLCL